MAKDFHKGSNIFPEGCDHPQLMDSAKRFFIYDNASFISEKDIAFFAGWLVANIKDKNILDSLHAGIEAHMQILEKDNGKEA